MSKSSTGIDELAQWAALLRPDAYHADLPSRRTSRHAIGEEEVLPASGTHRHRANVLFFYSGSQQLPAVRLDNVQVQLVSAVAVARSTGIHKQQRILLAHLVTVLHLVEQFGRVGELAGELVSKVVA